ncbi:microfibril-associated glycoprotein 4-like [Uranotaenia lowii]|uniref:microfibril-associated glycoprotein 4-like n=1 Tax=Uranotaenia lowii TaxID=190385 RepID=UPI0024798F8A|nr:microfibril-associated glycoprotein 4-like [Uranotaenia lowii]
MIYSRVLFVFTIAFVQLLGSFAEGKPSNDEVEKIDYLNPTLTIDNKKFARSESDRSKSLEDQILQHLQVLGNISANSITIVINVSPDVYCDQPQPPTDLPRSCADIPDQPSGVYQIRPEDSLETLEVFCDQDHDGGGWTVFQNRFDGSENFFRRWDDYEQGFGDLRGEFWLGLKHIHEMVRTRRHELHMVFEDFDGFGDVQKFDDFQLAGPEDDYRLVKLGSFHGTLEDALSFHVGWKFSTVDKDNDYSCALDMGGAWWYSVCYKSNLNAYYLGKGAQPAYSGMVTTVLGPYKPLRISRMMIRPKK